MTNENRPLEVRIGLNESAKVQVQLIEGDSSQTDSFLEASPEFMRGVVGLGFGRDIRKIRGPNVSEGRDYVVTMGVRPCEVNIYEAFKEGVHVGIQTQRRPDCYENQANQAFPSWYKAINRS